MRWQTFLILFVVIALCFLATDLSARNRRGYDIHPQLTLLDNFTPPMNKFFCGIARGFMGALPKGINCDSVLYEEADVNGVRIHIIRPKRLQGVKCRCLFYVHGGGFVFKASPNHYKMEQEYALRANCVVIGVDYSLAPKHCFPVALNECLEVLRYVVAKAEEFGIIGGEIVLAGDSAGALLALDMYRHYTERWRIASLMLVYPVVDHRGTTPSMERFVDTPGWNAQLNAKMWEWYLAGAMYSSPLEGVEEFRGLKRLFVEVEEFDCLRDEGVLLANEMHKLGVQVTLLDNKGTFHGYDVNRNADVVRESMAKRVAFLCGE